VEAEIASLQVRAERLAPPERELERLLAALAVEVDAARVADDAAAVERLSRKIRVVTQHKAQVVYEIRTLGELVEARRARYGLARTGPRKAKPPVAQRRPRVSRAPGL
jgi:hypothetical protein